MVSIHHHGEVIGEVMDIISFIISVHVIGGFDGPVDFSAVSPCQPDAEIQIGGIVFRIGGNALEVPRMEVERRHGGILKQVFPVIQLTIQLDMGNIFC